MPRVDITEIDIEQMMSFGERLNAHMVGANVALLIYIGDQLRLFDVVADDGPIGSVELATRAGLNQRYVKEWANALVAAGYLELDDEGRYHMTNAAIFSLADRDGPGYCGGPFQLIFGLGRNVPRLLDHFRHGGGIGYDEIGEDVTVGVERMWAPYHETFLPGWLQAVPGLDERLRAGATIADIGCGRGRSTVSLATLYPASTVVGIDADPASVAAARQLVAERGLTNAEVRLQSATDLTDEASFDFAYLFHTLHDIAASGQALAAIRRSLVADGSLLCVESSGSDDPMENRGSFGEMFATISPLFNLPVAMAAAGDGSGTIVSASAVEELAREAGFTSYERIHIDFPPPSLLHSYHLLRP